MSFFSLWVVARELSLGEGATVEEEEEGDDDKLGGGAEGAGAARLEVDKEECDVL